MIFIYIIVKIRQKLYLKYNDYIQLYSYKCCDNLLINPKNLNLTIDQFLFFDSFC